MLNPTPFIIDLGVSQIPHTVFILIHLAALAIGGYFATKAFGAGDRPAFAWGFTLYAIAEVIYIGYHVAATTFLLSHTLAEVLDLVAFILIFVGIGQKVVEARKVPATARV